MYEIPQQNFQCFVTMRGLITSIILPRNYRTVKKSPDQWLHNMSSLNRLQFSMKLQKKNIGPKKNLMQLWFRFSCLQRKLFNQLFEFFCEYGVFQFLCSFKRRKRRYQKNLRKCNWNGCGWTSTWSRTMRDSQTTENFCSSAVNKTVFSFKLACQL